MTYHPLPVVQSPLGEAELEKHPSHRSNDAQDKAEAATELIYEDPSFAHYEETSNIQLFFDLFFVANLTSFTGAHEINDRNSLSSYIAFFTILWFTWLQVTLYAVRFSTDSIFERLAHGCHFGVMVGLATVGPSFSPDGGTTSLYALQALSLIFMASRLVLAVQYAATTCFCWRYRTTRVPLMCTVVVYVLAATTYLGLFFAFYVHEDTNAYIGWFIVAIFETVSLKILTNHSKSQVLAFEGTHIVERLSCLTLIILGEGIIGLCRSIVTIVRADGSFSASAIGTIISAVLIIYLIYMLYFDNISMEKLGRARSRYWILLHFPLHTALVLLMEGTNQVLTWRHYVEYVDIVFAPIEAVSPGYSPNAAPQPLSFIVETFNSTVLQVTGDFPAGVTYQVWNSIQANMVTLADSSLTTAERVTAGNDIATELLKTTVEGFGFSAPEGQSTENLEDLMATYAGVFQLVFVYFFICAGLVLIFIGLLSYLTLLCTESHDERRRRYIGIGVDIILGIATTLLATMTLTGTAHLLGDSAWTLTVLVFVLMLALILNHIPRGSVVVGGPGRVKAKTFKRNMAGRNGDKGMIERGERGRVMVADGDESAGRRLAGREEPGQRDEEEAAMRRSARVGTGF